MFLSKGTFHFILIFICFCLVNVETAFGQQALFVEVELSCEATKDKKHSSFSTSMYGAIQGESIALTRTWLAKDSRGNGYAPLVGYIKNGKLIIKGKGGFAKSNDSWAYFFSSEGRGSIKTRLEAGIEGKEVSRKCALRLRDAVSYSDAISAPNTIKIMRARIADLKKELDNAIAEIRDNSSSEKTVKLENKIKLLSDQLASEKSKDDASNKQQIDAFKVKITELNTKIANLEKNASPEQAPSENLIQMAATIASLKDDLATKDALAVELQTQVESLQSEMQAAKNENISLFGNFEAQLSKKNEDIQNLTIALQTLKDTPVDASNCPIPVVSAETGGNDATIINYLEGKNAELTKQLENCGKGADKTAQDGNAPTPKPENAAKITDVVFENKWQLSDAVGCSSGSYTIYDKKLGNVFVLNGEKQISPNPTNVTITQQGEDKVRIVTEIFANDVFKQLNNGEPFAVFSSTEDITVLNEGQLNVERSIKQLDTNRFMSNPADKFYNTSKEGGKKASCGLLPGVEKNDQVSSGVSSEASKPAIAQKSEPLALPSGKFEAATFCAGVMTVVAGDDFIKSNPALASNMENLSARHLQAGGVLASRGLEGENMMVAGMQSVMDTVGDAIEEAEIERGSTLHGLIIDCSSLDTLG
jgi:hypothetical protein